MPTYEYACIDCGTHIEVFQRIGDEPLRVCGVCGGPVRKVFHPAGILFRGSGFYRTDNRRSPESGATREGGAKEASAKESASGSAGGGVKEKSA